MDIYLEGNFTYDHPYTMTPYETPSPFTTYGVKGEGEGGRMVAPPAIMRAVEDVLKPFNINIDEQPITPEKIIKWVAWAKTP